MGFDSALKLLGASQLRPTSDGTSGDLTGGFQQSLQGEVVAQNSRLPYSGNTSQEFGVALAGQFVPDNKVARDLFKEAQNLGTLERTTSPPEDRSPRASPMREMSGFR